MKQGTWFRFRLLTVAANLKMTRTLDYGHFTFTPTHSLTGKMGDARYKILQYNSGSLLLRPTYNYCTAQPVLDCQNTKRTTCARCSADCQKPFGTGSTNKHC